MPAAPKIPGKIFSHWTYKDDSGVWQTWTPGAQPAKDMTVYAQYDTPIQASYVVNYWYQNVGDELSYTDAEKTYSLLATETKTQDINTDVVSDSSKYEDTYHKYNQSKTEAANANKLVNPDGTTVVNVYYDRPVMTLTLVYYNLTDGTEDHREIFQAIYDHTADGIVSLDTTYRWTAAKDAHRDVSIKSFNSADPDSMIDSYHIEFHARELATTTAQYKVYGIKHYQNPDGSWTNGKSITKGVNTSDYKNYYLYFSESTGNYASFYYWANSADDFTTDVSASNPELNKYTAYEHVDVLKDGKPINDYDDDGISYLHVYIAKKSYQLHFVNTDNEPVTLLYEAPLTYAKDSLDHPIKPASVPSSYVFGGWYTTADFQEGTELNAQATTMEAQDKFVYAKWVEPNVTVTVEGNGATSQLPDTIVIPMHSTVHKDLPNIPSKDGYWFAGWYKDPDFTIPFDIDEAVDEDTTVYAKWTNRAQTSWTVRYLDSKGKILAETETGSADLYSVLLTYLKNIPDYTVDYASKNLTLTLATATNRLDFIYIYRVKTFWITEDKTTLKDMEYGTLEPETFAGYEFVTTYTSENGDTIHIYRATKPADNTNNGSKKTETTKPSSNTNDGSKKMVATQSVSTAKQTVAAALPKTGDTTHSELYLTVGVLSALCLGLFFFKSRENSLES